MDQKTPNHQTQEVHKLKIHRISLWVIILGIMLFALPHSPLMPKDELLNDVSILLGKTLIIGALISITYEYVVRKETYKMYKDIIRGSLTEGFELEKDILKNEIRKTVAESLMLNSNIQKEVLASEKRSEIIKACFTAELGKELSDELFQGIINPVFDSFRIPERKALYDYNIHLGLTKLDEKNLKNQFFSIQLFVEYSFILKDEKMLFACTNDLEIFMRYLRNPEITYIYFFPREVKLDWFEVSNVELKKAELVLPLKKLS